MLSLRTEIFVVEQTCPYQEVDDKDPSVDLVDGGNIRVHEVARAASDAPQLVHEGCLARVLKADEADVALLSQDAPGYFGDIYLVLP